MKNITRILTVFLVGTIILSILPDLIYAKDIKKRPFPIKLETAAVGEKASHNKPFFTNVLHSGVTSGWSKVQEKDVSEGGQTEEEAIYQGPSGRKYIYKSKEGIFKLLIDEEVQARLAEDYNQDGVVNASDAQARAAADAKAAAEAAKKADEENRIIITDNFLYANIYDSHDRYLYHTYWWKAHEKPDEYNIDVFDKFRKAMITKYGISGIKKKEADARAALTYDEIRNILSARPNTEEVLRDLKSQYDQANRQKAPEYFFTSQYNFFKEYVISAYNIEPPGFEAQPTGSVFTPAYIFSKIPDSGDSLDFSNAYQDMLKRGKKYIDQYNTMRDTMITKYNIKGVSQEETDTRNAIRYQYLLEQVSSRDPTGEDSRQLAGAYNDVQKYGRVNKGGHQYGAIYDLTREAMIAKYNIKEE